MKLILLLIWMFSCTNSSSTKKNNFDNLETQPFKMEVSQSNEIII